MADHRPLSDWVTDVVLDLDGVARRDPWAIPNGGDERADARKMERFARSSWQRRRVQLPDGVGALGLIDAETGEAVVELDQVATPIPVTDQGLALIEMFEEAWPDVRVSADDLRVLRGESIPVRYHLLDRLASEGRPSAELFHVLPWPMVERLAGEIVAALDGKGPASTVAVYHWFVPTGSRFTGALEQLNEGLRTGQIELVRAASTGLCLQLLSLDISRVPAASRNALRALVERLPRRDPFLLHAAQRAADRLKGAGRPDPRSVIQLPALLAPAAVAESRAHTERLGREPLTINATVTDTGRLTVAVWAAMGPEEVQRAVEAYGVVLVRVTVRAGEESTGYLIPLHPRAPGLVGDLDVPGPRQDVEVTVDEAPIGAGEARFLNVDEVLRSVRGAKRAGYAAWKRLAVQLPPGGPVHRALAADEEAAE
jgi:hypothetical protein